MAQVGSCHPHPVLCPWGHQGTQVAEPALLPGCQGPPVRGGPSPSSSQPSLPGSLSWEAMWVEENGRPEGCCAACSPLPFETPESDPRLGRSRAGFLHPFQRALEWRVRPLWLGSFPCAQQSLDGSWDALGLRAVALRYLSGSSFLHTDPEVESCARVGLRRSSGPKSGRQAVRKEAALG